MTNKQNKQNNQEEISDEIVSLVIDRLLTIPPNVAISIGKDGSFKIGELIERVKARDDIGKKIIEMQLHYLRSLPEILKQKNIEQDAAHNKALL